VPPIPPITRQQVREFEMLQSRCVESLMRPVGAIEGNGQGYAYFEKSCAASLVRASLSTNPYAWSFCSTYGLTREMDATALADVVAFFHEHGVATRVRIVPDGFTKDKAALLASYGLRHYGFHTVMWSPLPLVCEPDPPSVRVQHVEDPAEFDLALDVQLEGWGVPYDPDSPIKKLRRCWRTLPAHRTYLAYLDGEPAGHAMLYLDGKLAYLESAAVIKRFRNRGVHTALIRRRIAEAKQLGCETIVGGADFESPSRNNQLRAGLQIAYLAALWTADSPGSGG
jgi:GNAT superfamily N-acetyltransferase